MRDEIEETIFGMIASGMLNEFFLLAWFLGGELQAVKVNQMIGYMAESR